jgi:hypothetical protein
MPTVKPRKGPNSCQSTDYNEIGFLGNGALRDCKEELRADDKDQQQCPQSQKRT